jgi:hypothetical protein
MSERAVRQCPLIVVAVVDYAIRELDREAGR